MKKNNEIFSKSEDFKKSYESVLSNLNRPPNIVERSKLGSILELIQDEENLLRDFDQKKTKTLKAAEVDYLIYGNFFVSPFSDTVFFQSECIKVSGNSGLTKFVFPTITLTEGELSNLQIFESKVRTVLNDYAFVADLGIVENEVLSEINRRLDMKDLEILQLQSKVDAIIEYSDMAELDIFGLGKFKGGFGITISSPLNDMMKKALKEEEGQILVITGEEAKLTVGKIIQEFPRFPFGYYAKACILFEEKDAAWRKYANQAVEILEKTTMIHGHHDHHDQVLTKLRSLLNKF
ncbi:MAG: hypothetical protein IPN33_03160 [Saprospiraceae bacterium]|nr:hypothetical protein [Saprospiraceae bacterium]